VEAAVEGGHPLDPGPEAAGAARPVRGPEAEQPGAGPAAGRGS